MTSPVGKNKGFKKEITLEMWTTYIVMDDVWEHVQDNHVRDVTGVTRDWGNKCCCTTTKSEFKFFSILCLLSDWKTTCLFPDNITIIFKPMVLSNQTVWIYCLPAQNVDIILLFFVPPFSLQTLSCLNKKKFFLQNNKTKHNEFLYI